MSSWAPVTVSMNFVTMDTNAGDSRLKSKGGKTVSFAPDVKFNNREPEPREVRDVLHRSPWTGLLNLDILVNQADQLPAVVEKYMIRTLPVIRDIKSAESSSHDSPNIIYIDNTGTPYKDKDRRETVSHDQVQKPWQKSWVFDKKTENRLSVENPPYSNVIRNITGTKAGYRERLKHDSLESSAKCTNCTSQRKESQSSNNTMTSMKVTETNKLPDSPTKALKTCRKGSGRPTKIHLPKLSKGNPKIAMSQSTRHHLDSKLSSSSNSVSETCSCSDTKPQRSDTDFKVKDSDDRFYRRSERLQSAPKMSSGSLSPPFSPVHARQNSTGMYLHRSGSACTSGQDSRCPSQVIFTMQTGLPETNRDLITNDVRSPVMARGPTSGYLSCAQ